MFRGDEVITVFEKRTDVEYDTSIRSELTICSFVRKHLKDDSGILNIDKKFKIKTFNINTELYNEYTYIDKVCKIESKYNNLIEIYVDKNVIRVVPDHMLYVKIKNSPVELCAEELNGNDIVISTKYGWKSINKINKIDFEGYVYGIELDKSVYFSANNIIC